MIVSEYVRGLKNNYVRIRELALPDERKYQYCIMKRGGITGFLPFEIRYIDSDAYMYYDITSRQNVSTLYSKKPLDRKWLLLFFSAAKRIKNEAVRFLLDTGNIIWNPSNVYQDLNTGNFGFLYVPYLSEDNGMSEMMEFLVAHVDYNDEELVKCIYSVAEQYKDNGDVYLQEKVFLDVEQLRKETDTTVSQSEVPENDDNDKTAALYAPGMKEKLSAGIDMDEMYEQAEKIGNGFKSYGERPLKLKPGSESGRYDEAFAGKNGSRGIWSIFGRIRAKDRQLREEYDLVPECENAPEVAEETTYSDPEPEPEGTVFVDLTIDDHKRKLVSETGHILMELGEDSVVIGKKEAEADLIMEEPEVSRMHARVYFKDGEYYIEDLNSTNGTYKNGVRLKPYEQKKLVKGDEIRIATRRMVFA